MDNLIERIVNRRSCPKCGAIFNIKTMTMKNEGKCDLCGADFQRKPDRRDVERFSGIQAGA